MQSSRMKLFRTASNNKMSAEKKLWLGPHITSHKVRDYVREKKDMMMKMRRYHLKVLSALWKIGNDANARRE